MPVISIIVPVLNEAPGLADCLDVLQPFRRQGCELIVVDGGSSDATPMIAAPLADRVLAAPRGRAAQMNAGAGAAQGNILWFVHGDSRPPPDAPAVIRAALASGRVWGRFDVRLSGRGPLLRLVEFFMNRRSRLTGIATGDQGIFADREAFRRAGGYPAIALMEDIALSRRLKDLGRPACVTPPIITSSRRWERHGVARTILLMWRLRLAYFLGADPARLARTYYGG